MRVLVLICLLLTVFGCARKEVKQDNISEAVGRTLVNAAEESHNNLAMLARLRGQARPPILPPADATLQEPISISWTGPANGALKAICLKIGYRFTESGKVSAQQPPVVVQAFNRPAYEVLEDIAWQIQPNAVIRLDIAKRQMTLMGAAEAAALDQAAAKKKRASRR